MIENELTALLQKPLPSKNFQRRRRYRPTKDEIYETYHILNTHIFDSKLIAPPINVRTMNVWGLCTGYDEPTHRVKIKLSNDFYCAQWMTLILAHEMAHQYQWMIHGVARKALKKEPLISHGPSFYEFGKKMRSYGIPLKILYNTDNWFKYQDLSKV